MKVKRQELCAVLNSLRPGLASSEIVEQSTHFLFDKTRIYTFNDEIMVTHQFDSGIKGSVEAQVFLKILQKIPDEEVQIQIESSDNDDSLLEMLITGKKRKLGMKMVSDIGIEIPFNMQGEEWFKLPEDFTQGLRLCIFSASKDATKGPLICINSEGKELSSCDNYRLTVYQMSTKFQFPFLIPRSSAEYLIDYNPVLFSKSEAWLHFQNKDKVVFSCRTMGGEYPQVRQFLEFEGKPFMFPSKFRESVERAGVLATSEFDYDRVVEISISEDKITCRGEGKQGWIEEEEDVRYSGKEVSFRVHPSFFLEILQHSNKAKIGEDKLLFVSSKFQHVVALSG